MARSRDGKQLVWLVPQRRPGVGLETGDEGGEKRRVSRKEQINCSGPRQGERAMARAAARAKAEAEARETSWRQK